jgi:hypothetical protein
MAENAQDEGKKNPVIICNPERMNDLIALCQGQVPDRQPDNKDSQPQEKNELEKCDEVAPERWGFSVDECH